MYKKYIKRILDVVLSLILILLLWPVLFIIAILVRFKLGSPIIFKQERPGLNEKVFTLYKFRTMTDEKDANGNLMPDSVRLTKFGKALRSTSLDELPELWNILKGDMSFIGPRPLLVEYLPLYNEKQKHRHDVRPGLTGLAQINGRNNLSWKERFEFDLKYVSNISLKEDILIFIKTIGVVFKRKDVTTNKTQSGTMDMFKGTENKNN